MDQRRFISFLILSMAVLILYDMASRQPEEPEPPAPPVAAEADVERPAEADVVDADPDAQPAEAGPRPRPAEPAELADIDVEKQYVTIGSLDPDSGHRMLVTLTNTGATVHRTELSSERYRDLHDRSGYLGELELRSVEGGLQVQAVGPGTPAALAEIEAGDVIVGIGGSQAAELRTIEQFNVAMAETRPGQQITLQVRRGEEPPRVRVAQLAWRPLAVLRPEIENYRMRDEPPPADFIDPPSFLLTMLPQLNEDDPLADVYTRRIARLLEQGNWEITERDATSVTFRRPLPELNLELTKRYTVAAVPPDQRGNVNYPGYHLQLDVELRNTAEAAQTVAYRLDGPTGMPLEGWWYAHKISQQHWFAQAGLRDVAVRFDGNRGVQIDGPSIAKSDIAPMGHGQALTYAGVDGQYFAAVLIPEREALYDSWFDTVEAILAGQTMVRLDDGTLERRPRIEPRAMPTFTNVTCRLTRNPIEVAAGETHRDSFRVFIGPKRPDLLAQYYAAGDPNYSLSDIVYYGLALFGAVARAMLVVLHFFYGIVGNYGIAIIMLTVLVRGMMFPLSYKQTKNMARMQELKPEMDRLTEKYKTDLQKRSQAMQELYRKHQINPLGGCLPVFLQLPIFIGLYRALMVDVELRQSPLFGHAIRWCSNLAAPDMLFDWSWLMPDFITRGVGMFVLGPYFNVLPIVTVSLFLVTQKMFMPPPTNEQAAMQQKMMKYMMIFMGLIFYKVASGLCLYFIASSLWGIAERKLLPKSQIAAAAAAGGAGSPTPGTAAQRPRDGGANGRPAPKKKPRKARRKK